MKPFWKIGCASHIGQSHLDRDVVCQDHCAINRIVPQDGVELLVAAVSDGAGSAKHSDIGSRIVCESFADFVQQVARQNPNELWRQELFEVWHANCLGLMQQEARQLGSHVKQLAATALLAIVAPDRAMFFQIGDGGIVLSTPDDRCRDNDFQPNFCWVFWPSQGEEYDNLTTFVTSPNAMDKANGCLSFIEIDYLALFSDGVEHAALEDRTRSAHKPFFKKCFEHFLDTESDVKRSEKIAAILASPSLAKVSDDDKSLVLAVSQRG